MRLIKLSADGFDNPSEVEIDRYFQGPELRQRGFIFPEGRIAQTGLQIGELLLFSFRSTVLYVAKAASVRQPYKGQHFEKYPYCVHLDPDSIRQAYVSVQEFERALRQKAGLQKNITLSRGWPRLPDGDAAQTLVEQLVLKSLAPTNDEGAEEGLKEDKTVGFRRRNAGIIAKRREMDGNACQACGFRLVVNERYIIDCHHLYPLEEGVRITRISDLVCLCPTCHRIAHARHKPYNVLEIKSLRETVAAAQTSTAEDAR